MNKIKTFIALTTFTVTLVNAQQIITQTNPETGGIRAISIDTDINKMNWIINADNLQYEWIGREYEWGLGETTIIQDDGEERVTWEKALSYKNNKVEYNLADKIRLTVVRSMRDGDLEESYFFKNITKKPLRIEQTDINIPFNDNYPEAAVCMTNRCNAHIWAGGDAAYVCAMRMGAIGPHLGLMLTEGNIDGYSVKGRGQNKGSSNMRGVLCLQPHDTCIKPGEEMIVKWVIFTHDGQEDFARQMKLRGGVMAQTINNRYVYEIGDTAILVLNSQKGEIIRKNIVVDKTGINRVYLSYGKNKQTYIDLWGITNIDSLLEARAKFIIERQQYNNTMNVRCGAFMPYDNEKDEIYLNFKAEQKRADLNEGAERTGMGLFLALMQQKTPSQQCLEALRRYAVFIREQLQYPDYETWSMVEKRGRHRPYNYPWIADFYLEMFNITKEKIYLVHSYKTMRKLFSRSGHNFYAIDMPVKKGIDLMRANKMENEADSLLADYRLVADNFIKNGTNFPKSEVNYEQSIVAPCVSFLCEMYLVTKEKCYLDNARKMMPVLEAFAGHQPSVFFYDIAIRHWDGYWFGKYRFWGDTMPHYWSCLSADAFARYWQCTGDITYMKRAKNILLNNLCLFTEDGRGYCVRMAPLRVNNVKMIEFDPLSNDQDFALMYFMKWMKDSF